ncbi:MAG TPA: hypothetical protein VLD17_06075 [Gemmatimonadaceae bacterium]|nr:hypothetical protein [Gemmatimonadaceae bacterium]
MSQTVSPAARRRDLIALLILAAGALVASYGYLGLHHMAAAPIVRVRGQTAMARAIAYTNIVRTGWGMIAIGIAAVVWSFVANRKSAGPTD